MPKARDYYNGRPRPGSKLRNLYEFFHEHKEKFVEVPTELRGTQYDFKQRIMILRDFYDMEFKVRRRARKNALWKFTQGKETAESRTDLRKPLTQPPTLLPKIRL